MPKVRQQYLADEVSLEKELLTFKLDDELKQKIDDIDARAQENVIEIVKRNGVPLPVDANKAVDVEVPGVVDALDSISTGDALSANQGKILYDYIVNLQSRGRFLSSWDCANGTPVTAPFGTGYVYNPGDYFVVTAIAPSGGTNFRPEGTVYSGGQSVTPETETVDISDMYVFDGVQWLFQKNTARQIAIDPTLSTTSTNPVENRVITNALNSKQDILTAGANIQINNNVISATGYSNLPAAQGGTADTLVTTGDKYNWNHKQDELQAGANIQINGNVISATNTTYGNFPEAQGGTTDTLVTTGDKYNWNHKQDGLTAGANIQISGGVISATDTTYTAGSGINIDNNNVISADDTNAVWGNITGNISNQTDLINLLNGKQNVLTAGNNIQINNDVISATDTTYSAGNGININAYNEIVNEKPFDPTNPGLEGQVLKRDALGGYGWANESGGGGGASVDNTPFSPAWDGVTGIAPSKNAVYDKINAMDITIASKQNILTAGDNITIQNDIISAVDTKYTAADFDIKDLADSTDLRTTWNNKQDTIVDLPTIREGAALGMTALQSGDNVSELVNDAGYITKAVNDLTNYYTKNETYTKTEVDNLLANFAGFEIVSTLPATGNPTIIYLLGPSANNTYEEYIYTNNQWVKIGETTIDLTNYFHKGNDDSDDITEGSIHLFITPSERTKLAGLVNETRTTIMNKLGAANSTRSGYLTSTDRNIFNNKQDALTAGANIQISANNVISATDTKYTGGTGISVSGTTINNTLPFNPSNSGTNGQVLTKTSSGYSWQPSQGGGGGGAVTSVNGQTGDVYVKEFDPDNNGSAGQILKRTSSGYLWANEGGGGGGGGVTSVNGRTGAVTVNEVSSGGSTGQVLTKTSSGYGWSSPTTLSNVRCWGIDTSGSFSSSMLQEVWEWISVGISNKGAILRDSYTDDAFIYVGTSTSGSVIKLLFRGVNRYTGIVTTTSGGNYTKGRCNDIEISIDISGGTGHYTYSAVIKETDNDYIKTNYISAMSSGYDSNHPYLPTDNWQPTTKAYVDQTVDAALHGVTPGTPIITNDRGGTQSTITAEWVGTQAQYNTLVNNNQISPSTIYNII